MIVFMDYFVFEFYFDVIVWFIMGGEFGFVDVLLNNL